MPVCDGVYVRAAEQQDADAVDQLFLYLDQFHAEARPDLFRVPSDKPRGETFLQAVLEDPRQHVLVAVKNGEAVGFAHVILKRSPPGNPRVERQYSEIDSIAVHPSAQRLGAGRALLEAALNWAASNGVHDHQVAVHDFNRAARRLYERLGFAPSVTLLRQKL
jgi:ribosomal protein S18 acetylase RimI-like enzyme